MTSLRRLASDQASLRKLGLPPNYLFPPSQDSSVLPDDLTQLTVLLTGPHGTPYAQGLWQFHLRMPTDYPKNPPKATFKTPIWHPNVEESTGVVCLETLKRDWDPKLTLRDVLVTISCLLIQPNPDSALNSAAGSLLQEDFEAFAGQARLMASIHARIPAELRQVVDAARSRGEEDHFEVAEEEEDASSLADRQFPPRGLTSSCRKLASHYSRLSPLHLEQKPVIVEDDDVSDDENHDPAKENDPSQSPDAAIPSARSPRKKVLGKRPLSELPTPTDSGDEMTGSEMNVAVNQSNHETAAASSGRAKKSPRLLVPSGGSNSAGRLKEVVCGGLQPISSATRILTTVADEEKENVGVDGEGGEIPSQAIKIPVRSAQHLGAAAVRPSLRKVSQLGLAKGKIQPRVGIRRL